MNGLTHVDQSGAARMVDVGGKAETERRAIASGTISMSPQCLEAIRSNALKKGDAFAVARVAGILAAKQTSQLIPLCHPLPITAVEIDFDFEHDGVRARATVSVAGKTGVEMEALTAVSVALLTLYDMGKSVDKSMMIKEICLIEKTGGKSGNWTRPE